MTTPGNAADSRTAATEVPASGRSAQTEALRASHTPGPWRFDEDDDQIRTDRICVALVTRGVDNALDEKFGGPVHRANGRLIASAPDLLHTLRVMVYRYVSLVNGGDCGNWDPETEPEVIAARAALAKAEGGAR